MFLVIPGTLFLFFFKEFLGQEIHEVDLISYNVLLFAGSYTMIFFLVAYLVCRDIDVMTSRKFISTSDRTISSKFIYILFLIQIFFLSLHFLHIGLNNIPLTHLIAGDEATASQLRLSIIAPGGIIKLPYIFVFIDLYIKFLPLYLILTNKSKLIIVLSLSLTLLYLVYDLQKGPILIYFLCMYSIKKGFNFNFKNIILFALLFVVFVAIYSSSKNIEMSRLLFFKVINRLFILQHQSLYLTIDVLDSNWLNAFHHIPILDKMFDLPTRYDVAVMKVLNYDMTRNVNMNGIFFAEAYSISPIIYLLAPIMIFLYLFMLRFVFKIFAKINYHAAKSIFCVMLFYYFPISQSFNQIFISSKMILFWLSAFSLIYFISILSRTSTRVEHPKKSYNSPHNLDSHIKRFCT